MVEKCPFFAHHGAWYARGSNLIENDGVMELILGVVDRMYCHILKG